jgi:Glycosyltransferase family 87
MHLLQKASAWLTPRRIRTHAILLAVCAWGVVAADFATPGMMDRAGNIKFQDFIQFYIAARQIHRGETSQLYDPQVAAARMQAILGHPTPVRLPPVYGPQVGLFFVPFGRLPFLTAAAVWTGISAICYLFCCYAIWRACSSLRGNPGLAALAVLAFPPFFHFVIRGQISALILACFVGGFFALRAGHEFVAGLLLGSLVLKPQFLLGILAVLLLGKAWSALSGAVTAMLLQLAGAWWYFGRSVMLAYARTLWHLPQVIAVEEPGASNAQMHSLRSFWLLLVSQPALATSLYVVSGVFILTLAAMSWRCSGPLALRFSALTLAAVLVNPHLFVYDLLVLAPVLLLLVDWVLHNPQHPASAAMRVLLYLAYLLPLFGPLALWTHVQLSVLAFVAMQILLWRILRESNSSAAQAARSSPLIDRESA